MSGCDVGAGRSVVMKLVTIGICSTAAPFNGACMRREIGRRLAGQEHGRSDHFTRRRGTPRFGVSEQRHVAGLDHLDGELVELPAPAELPRLEPRVRQPVLRRHLAHVVGGALVRGRRGEPRADRVHQHVEHRLDLRSIHAFVFDLRDDRGVNGLLRGPCRHTRGDGHPGDDGGDDAVSHGPSLLHLTRSHHLTEPERTSPSPVEPIEPVEPVEPHYFR